MFYRQGNLYSVYGPMEVSLAEIQATPYGIFEAYHIAVICQKVWVSHRLLHWKLTDPTADNICHTVYS